MSSRVIYLNGQFLPESEAKVSVYDLGVMQAAAVFEMTRSFHGTTFKLREHVDRLMASIATIGILPTPQDSPYINKTLPFEYFRAGMEKACQEVMARNDHGPGEEHRLLICVSPGPAPMYREIAGDGPTVLITDFPLRYTTAGLGRQFTEGGTAIISSVEQISNQAIPCKAKHRSRLAFHLAQQEAIQRGADWAILLDHDGNIAESPGANVLLVEGGVLINPTGTCLDGISRAYVLELAEALGIPCESSPVAGSRLSTADEIILTGTPFCALSLVNIDGHQIGDGTPGPVYKKLLAAWSESVKIPIDKQIIEWDNETYEKSHQGAVLSKA